MTFYFKIDVLVVFWPIVWIPMTCCVLLKLEYKNELSDMILKSKDEKKNPKISDFISGICP